MFSFCALILQVYRVRIAKSTEGGIPYAAGKMEGGAYCRITPQTRELTRQWDKNAHIDRQLYEKYDVKRGLRDATGRGVLTSSPAWPGGALTAWRSWARGAGSSAPPPSAWKSAGPMRLWTKDRRLRRSCPVPPRAGRENLPDILKINA